MLVLAFAINGVAYGQECSQLLKQGIYDISSSSTDLNTASSFSQWFCDENFSSAQEADNFGASLGFPFKGVPVKLGLESGSESWSESYSRFCANYKNDSSLQLKLRNHVKTISGTVVNAFNTCISSRGLHVWIERTHNPREFKFAARFNPPNKNNPVAIIQTFDEGSNVSCKQRPLEIDSSEFRSRCTRKNDNPVSLIVNADWAPIGGGNLTLPAIRKNVPPPAKPTTTVCSCVGHGGVQGVRFWGPKGEACNGIQGWGTYSQQCQPDTKRICKCQGHGGVEGVTLWGPEGQPCGGMPNNAWGTYSAGCVDLTKSDICACKGNGNVIGGMDIWGPKGDFCGGFSGWGEYSSYCK